MLVKDVMTKNLCQNLPELLKNRPKSRFWQGL